jgi:sugar/nucleoside kinase (ribokinase family)
MLTTGGGATNAAATFARLGYKSAVLCRVGDDSAGRDLIIELQREGITTTLIERVPGGKTGYATLLTDANTGERTVLVYRGVSGTFDEATIPWGTCRAQWFYMTSLGGDLALAKRVLQHAKSLKAHVVWNPGSKEIKKGLGALQGLLRHVSVLILNREEAKMLTQIEELDGMFKRLARHNTIILITDGEHGSYAHHEGTTWKAGTTGRKAVSRTGAGDAFGSGFTASYMQDSDIVTALKMGTLNADSVIREVGAKAGILKKWPTAAALKSIKVTKV